MIGYATQLLVAPDGYGYLRGLDGRWWVSAQRLLMELSAEGRRPLWVELERHVQRRLDGRVA